MNSTIKYIFVLAIIIIVPNAVCEELRPVDRPLISDSREISPKDKRLSININNRAQEKFSLSTAKSAKAPVNYEKDIGLIRGSVKSRSHGPVYTLKECIDIAAQNHLPLQTAKKSLKLAEMRLFEARRNLLPSATMEYQDYRGRINGQAYIGRKEYIEGQQPIFHGGELVYTAKQSETNLEITRTDYARIRNELVLQVKKAYYTLCKAKGNLRMQQELSQEVARIHDMVTRQSEAGVVSKIEVLNVASQSGQVKYQLTSAEGDMAVAELILKQAMNVNLKDQVDVKDELGFKRIAVDYDKALQMALVNRPEMKINSLMINYYNYGNKVAKAKLWPKVDLLGSWGLAKEEISPPDQDEINLGDADQKLAAQWYAGLKVSMPFWGSTGEYSLTKEHWVPVVSTTHGTDAFTVAYKAKILDKLDTLSEQKLSEIDFDKARQEFTKIKQDITLEVRESCFNYQKALIQSETAAAKVLYQTSDLELIKTKRGLEEAQDSNIIDGMVKLTQEKFGLLQALADCHISLASLNKAIGIEDYYKDE